jgi:HEAT repeat protein
MDMRREMVATHLREAVWADEETQQRLMQELARYPEETLGALIASIEHDDKPFLSLAAQAIRAIGYPKNAIALPCLVDLVSDQNVPERLDAILALQEMEVDAVVPYFLKYVLKRDDDNAGWSYGVDVWPGCILPLSSTRL